jgi:hypothetical protein
MLFLPGLLISAILFPSVESSIYSIPGAKVNIPHRSLYRINPLFCDGDYPVQGMPAPINSYHQGLYTGVNKKTGNKKGCHF